MQYDVYRRKEDHSERMAVRPGEGLPAHVEAKDWELMAAGTSPVIEDAEEDIAARGFCYFKLVPPASPLP